MTRAVQMRLAAIGALAAIAVGCGNAAGGPAKSKAAADAAQLTPADALAYVTIDADTSSAQLRSAKAILQKLPIGETLLRRLRASLAKKGTDLAALGSSVGSELDLAVLRVGGKTSTVGFARPADEKAFDAQLDTRKTMHTTLDGWTVFTDAQPFLDAVTSRKQNLSDDPSFREATRTIPADGGAIVRAYAATGGLQAALGATASSLGAAGNALSSTAQARWAAAALTSSDGAFKLEVHAKTKAVTAAAGSGLAAEIPAGSILALSTAGGGSALPAGSSQQLSTMSKQLGIDLAGLLGVLDGPVILYVRPGQPVPEITIAARPSHPARAVAAVAQLIRKLARPRSPAVPATVDGVTLQKLDLGAVQLYDGVDAGQVVVTDDANAVSELRGSLGHLDGDTVFQDARSGAGLPDASQGFLFLDVEHALPVIQSLARLSNQTLPASVVRNLRPLRSLLLFGSEAGGIQTFVVYLKTA